VVQIQGELPERKGTGLHQARLPSAVGRLARGECAQPGGWKPPDTAGWKPASTSLMQPWHQQANRGREAANSPSPALYCLGDGIDDTPVR